jgi:predicted outer membrane repeat protein
MSILGETSRNPNFKKGIIQMQVKMLTVAARTATVGAATVLCLGGAQAALAAPRATITVPCQATALSTAMSGAVSGATLSLTPGCTYVLTAALPTLNKGLTITGHGATVERSYAVGTPDFSIFTVDNLGGVLNLIDVNVQHGGGDKAYYGGAIDNGGVVTIDGGAFSHSDGGEYGGAIYNDGSLTVQNASFLDNTGYYGGAIYSYHNLTITGTSFTGNTSWDGYGGAIYTDGANVQIAGSKFTDNSTDYVGGAIDNSYDMTLTGSTFIGNWGEYGGGVYSSDLAALSGDTFTSNGAAFGGGLYNQAGTTVGNSTFTDNDAYFGGGIYNNSGTLKIDNSLISLNSVTDEGGGIYNDATLTTDNTFSVKGNSAAVGGGGIYNNGKSSVNLFYAQVTGNHPDNCEPVNTIGGCSN